jgi:hypothetical protein
MPFVSRLLPTVVETSVFARRAEKLLTDEEHEDLLLYLAMYYKVGDKIPGTGGVRKLRYAVQGRGKSGGIRAIYYFFDEQNPLYGLLLYGKNEQGNLSAKQKKYVKAIATAVKTEARKKRKRR